MKKSLLFCIAALVIAATAVTGFSAHNRSEMAGLLAANIAALTNNEGGGGLAGNEEQYTGMLWKKYWVGCGIITQIIVTQSSGSINAGVYYYTASLLAQLESSNISYTLVSSGSGQKSYCYDGWWLCSSDDCR